MSDNIQKVLADVPHLRWGVGRDNTVMGALAAALHWLGDEVTYDQLMGASGAAFRVQVHQPGLCPSAPFASVGCDVTGEISRITGRDFEWIEANPDDPFEAARRDERTKASIDAGRPVLYPSFECGLCVGYDESGFLMRTYFDTGDTYSHLKEWGWAGAGIIGEKNAEPNWTDLFLGSLEQAARFANSHELFGEGKPDDSYVIGFDAFESWTDTLVDERRFAGLTGDDVEGMTNGNSWCYLSLMDARASAARYLDEYADYCGLEAGDALHKASETWRHMVLRLRDGLDDVPRWERDREVNFTETAKEGAINWSPAARVREAQLLRTVAAMDAEALGLIEDARTHI